MVEMNTDVALHHKLEVLSPNLRNEVFQFIDFLIARSGNNQQNVQRIFGGAKGKIQKTYTALDFLDEWSGAFGYLDDEDAEKAKYEYLSQKYG